MSEAEARPALWHEMETNYSRSPIHRGLGLSLRVVGEGEVVVDYDGSEGASNRRGNAAGGAMAEMIDSAVMQACRTMLAPKDFNTTLELKINFTRAAPPGGRLTTTGRIEHIGRTTAVGTGRIVDAEGRLVALGIVTIAIKRAEG
jgi:uncharacterized protein (TIGR00369 family)